MTAEFRPLTSNEIAEMKGEDRTVMLRSYRHNVGRLRATILADAERLASLQAERDAFALLLSDAETERDMALSRNAEVEAQLALRDAVVEAARRRCDLLRWAAADHDPVKPRPFDDTRSFADHLRQADADMNDALAALDASENPRGATEEDAGT